MNLCKCKNYSGKQKKPKPSASELNANWGTICTPVEMIAADGAVGKNEPPSPWRKSLGTVQYQKSIKKQNHLFAGINDNT